MIKLRKIKKSFLFILILFVSIGFAVLTANLSIGSVLSFRQNTFDIHIENPSIYETSTAVDSTASLTNSTTLTFNTTYTKLGDAVDILFYIVNDGTVDASISSITTTLTSAQCEYITYRFNYVTDNSLVSNNDIIYAGQARKVIGHFEYKYDIDDFIDLDNFSTSVTINFVQAQSSNNNVWAYEYVGDYQTFVAPKTGSYKIELWGASGRALYLDDIGKGAYTSGKVNLDKGDILYLYIGGSRKYASTTNPSHSYSFYNSFNSGSSATTQFGISDRYWGVGGGATDVRLV